MTSTSVRFSRDSSARRAASQLPVRRQHGEEAALRRSASASLLSTSDASAAPPSGASEVPARVPVKRRLRTAARRPAWWRPRSAGRPQWTAGCRGPGGAATAAARGNRTRTRACTPSAVEPLADQAARRQPQRAVGGHADRVELALRVDVRGAAAGRRCELEQPLVGQHRHAVRRPYPPAALQQPGAGSAAGPRRRVGRRTGPAAPRTPGSSAAVVTASGSSGSRPTSTLARVAEPVDGHPGVAAPGQLGLDRRADQADRLRQPLRLGRDRSRGRRSAPRPAPRPTSPRPGCRAAPRSRRVPGSAPGRPATPWPALRSQMEICGWAWPVPRAASVCAGQRRKLPSSGPASARAAPPACRAPCRAAAGSRVAQTASMPCGSGRSLGSCGTGVASSGAQRPGQGQDLLAGGVRARPWPGSAPTVRSRATRRPCARPGAPAPSAPGRSARSPPAGVPGGSLLRPGRRLRQVHEDGPPGVGSSPRRCRTGRPRRGPGRRRKKSTSRSATAGSNAAGSRVTSSLIAAGFALSPQRGSVPVAIS